MQFTREEDEWAKFFGKARSFDAGIFFKEEFEKFPHAMYFLWKTNTDLVKPSAYFDSEYILTAKKKSRSFRDEARTPSPKVSTSFVKNCELAFMDHKV